MICQSKVIYVPWLFSLVSPSEDNIQMYFKTFKILKRESAFGRHPYFSNKQKVFLGFNLQHWKLVSFPFCSWWYWKQEVNSIIKNPKSLVSKTCTHFLYFLNQRIFGSGFSKVTELQDKFSWGHSPLGTPKNKVAPQFRCPSRVPNGNVYQRKEESWGCNWKPARREWRKCRCGREMHKFYLTWLPRS